MYTLGVITATLLKVNGHVISMTQCAAVRLYSEHNDEGMEQSHFISHTTR